MYLVVNSIFSGIIFYILFSITFDKLTVRKDLDLIKKPLGIKLSFFVTGVLIYLLSYNFNFV